MGERQNLPNAHYYKGALFFTPFPQETLEYITNTFVFRRSDVVLAAYPKTGQTWTQEIIWLLMNDCNVEESKKNFIMQRIPYLDVKTDQVDGVKAVEALPDPRCYKTHLQLHMLPEPFGNSKVIVNLRNCKDVLVSWYHHYRLFPDFEYTDTFDDFFELFKQQSLLFGDYFKWNAAMYNYGKDKDNFLFITYEELLQNPLKAVSTIAKFINVEDKNNLLERVVEASSFSSMKNNPSTNLAPNFIREGKIGGWKKYLSKEQSFHVDMRVQNELNDMSILYDINAAQAD